MFLKSYIKLIRLHQPTGIILLFLPCLFGIILASKQNLDFSTPSLIRITLLFFAGSIIMRSAGCVINDILDRKFDKEISRTRNRPLASGEISLFEALFLLIILLFLGLLILLQFNLATIVNGFASLALVALYPLSKRFTNYPQIILGLTFNFGVIMSGLAINNSVNFSTLILYVAAIIWTLIYDTIYAFQDLEDDLKIGVKSSAIKFATNPKKYFTLSSLAMFLFLVFLGFLNNFKSEFFFTILLASLFLDYKIQKCDLKNPENCLKAFKANIWVGILISLAIILG